MGLKFDEFQVGASYESARRTVREADIQLFAGLSADYNPLHTDEQYVKENTGFRQCIAHGALTFAMSTGFSFQDGLTRGTTLGFLGTEIAWKKPVYAGDTIHMVTTVLDKIESKKPGRGIVVFGRDIYNQDGELCMASKATLLVKRDS
ncbi:MAG: MaoC family dehydratase N-terminal domain-containing protein [Oscillospiraceae bacterium]